MQSEPTPPGFDQPAGDQVPVYDRGEPRHGWRDRIVAGALSLVVGAGAGFAVGRTTASSGPATLAEALQQAQQGRLPTGNRQGNRTTGGGVQGYITAISGDVITISTPAGDLKVKLGGETTILKAVSAAKGDLAVGDTVSVRIDPSASGGNGTATASSITKEPAQ